MGNRVWTALRLPAALWLLLLLNAVAFAPCQAIRKARPRAERFPLAFCNTTTPRYFAPDPEWGVPELRMFVDDWEGYGRYHGQRDLQDMRPHIDQCKGQRPFRAIMVHKEEERERAHAILYNAAPYLWYRSSKFVTFSRHQKVVAYYREHDVHEFFPHPDSDVEVSRRLEAELVYPSGCFGVQALRNPTSAIKVPNVMERTKGVAAVISNCQAQRLNALQALMEHVQVDSYGRCLHNTNFSSDGQAADDRIRQKELMLKKYRALLAWENSQEEGYITEKIFNALNSGVVPVYWGAPDIEQYVPKEMIINANDYTPETMHLLAAKLRRLQEDDAYYQSFFPSSVSLSPPQRYVEACDRTVSWRCAAFDEVWRQRDQPSKRSQLCPP